MLDRSSLDGLRALISKVGISASSTLIRLRKAEKFCPRFPPKWRPQQEYVEKMSTFVYEGTYLRWRKAAWRRSGVFMGLCSTFKRQTSTRQVSRICFAKFTSDWLDRIVARMCQSRLVRTLSTNKRNSLKTSCVNLAYHRPWNDEEYRYKSLPWKKILYWEASMTKAS